MTIHPSTSPLGWLLQALLLIPGATLVVHTGALALLILGVHWLLHAARKLAALEDPFTTAVLLIKMAASLAVLSMAVASELLTFYHQLFGHLFGDLFHGWLLH
ncbi:MAG: hypothetical protein P4L83_11260 [Nevskia sp.]|nr:hypothetical protein [Nevskia sp.]